MRVVLAALLALAPMAAHAATLTIKVENIDPKGGDLRVALYTEATWPDNDDEPAYKAVVSAKAPTTVLTINDIKPGVYGVKSFQDTNRNGEFDQNLIGLPLEPYGFSRDAVPYLSAPAFDRVSFTIKDGANEITIHLQ